jgi:glycosyltransferase involved in cell wall biosynthesis
MESPPKQPRIVFLNQFSTALFRELAESISEKWAPSVLVSGHHRNVKSSKTDPLRIIAAPRYYRDNHITRVVSWIKYLIFILFRCWRLSADALLFIVSNPPILGLFGYLCKRLRSQRYVVLVYDIHPDLLIKFGKLRQAGLIAGLWHKMNKLVWENAEVVFTIGNRMAESLSRSFDVGKTTFGEIVVVPNWADTNWIRPLAKEENEFARNYKQVGKVTVLYSGNLGQTHDIETILEAAKRLRDNGEIHFMIIGHGAKKGLVQKVKLCENLDNLTLLPFQPEELLPLSFAAGDISIVTMAAGSEGLMVPSKTYYAMAAGSALIGLCSAETEIADMIKKHNCGLVVEPGDVESLVKAILRLSTDKELSELKTNSRSAAEKFYSRNNVGQYIDALSKASLP